MELTAGAASRDLEGMVRSALNHFYRRESAVEEGGEEKTATSASASAATATVRATSTRRGRRTSPRTCSDGQLDRDVSDGLICDLFLNSVVAPAMYRHPSAAAGDGGDVGTAAIMERLAAELEEYVYLAAAFAGRDGALYRMVCMGNNLAAIAGEASSSSSCSSA